MSSSQNASRLGAPGNRQEAPTIAIDPSLMRCDCFNVHAKEEGRAVNPAACFHYTPAPQKPVCGCFGGENRSAAAARPRISGEHRGAASCHRADMPWRAKRWRNLTHSAKRSKTDSLLAQ